jgi:multidrug efflux pump subunit AcrA (membrane-fusion protein)
MAQGIVEPSSASSEKDQKKQQAAKPGGERARLIQRLLDAAGDLPTFVSDLVATQAVTVVGTEAAAFLVEKAGTDGNGNPQVSLRAIAHIRPDDSDAQTRAAALKAFQDLIARCVGEGKDGAIEVGPANEGGEAQFCLITLLRDGGEIVAVSAVVTRCRNAELARQRLASMQLVAGYFEFFALRRGAEASKQVAVNHQRVLQLSRAVADADGFMAAAMNLCNELANATGATRVSVGWLKGVQGQTVRVVALSHTEEFDKKQELIVQLERTMEECYDQETPVLYLPAVKLSAGLSEADGSSAMIVASKPSAGDALPATDAVTRQAALLSRAQGGHVVLSIPLRRHADIEGVVTMEFLSAEGLTGTLLESLTLAVDLVAPQLYDRHENDRWLITKAGLSARYWTEELVGPRHWVAKLITIAVVVLLLVLTNFFNLPARFPKQLGWADVRTTYHVTAPLTFAAVDRRSICAPFDGQIDQVYVLPGQPVAAGAKLFSMKTDELEKQALKAYAEAQSHFIKAAGYRNDPTKIADAKVEEEQAKASLAEYQYYRLQVAQGTIYAPFAGQVLTAKGDLSDKRDTEVKQGEEQMVFGDPDKLRGELQVKDGDIQDVSEGQRGTLATTSEPTNKVGFTVGRVVPLGTAKEGANVFTVYATLPDKVPAGWRPGMTGEARVDVGRKPWGWIWTHRLIDFVRLKLWM